MKRSAIVLLFDSQAGPSSWFSCDMPPWVSGFLTFLSTRLPISCFLVKYHSEMKCFFIEWKRKCSQLLNYNGFSLCIKSPRIASYTTPSAIDFATVLWDTSNAAKWVKVWLLLSKPSFFQFFINKALPPSNSILHKNFMSKKF